MELIEEIYALSNLLPEEERFGLRIQLRHAAVSAVAHLCEGFKRQATVERKSTFALARGECAQLLTLLATAVRVEKLLPADAKRAKELAKETSLLLSGLIDHPRTMQNTRGALSGK